MTAVIKAYGDAENPEYFELNGEFQPGYWKFYLYLHTGGSKYIYQASGVFDVMVDCTLAGKYVTPLTGKVSAHNTAINVDYGKLIELEPSVLIIDRTTTVKLALYPNSIVSPLADDYALGVQL